MIPDYRLLPITGALRTALVKSGRTSGELMNSGIAA